MFTLINVNLLSLRLYGPNVNAVGQLGSPATPYTPGQAGELSVRWQPVLPDTSVFSLLSWHSRLSHFSGRGAEMDLLEKWAESDHKVWIKFVISDGGVGKSRLGAEFAEHMREKGWAAGFVDFRQPSYFCLHKAGTLLIVDYPEEHIKGVTELLTCLAQVNPPSRLRVLFLTRQQPERWEDIIVQANARNICDMRPIELGPVDVTGAKGIFDSTVSEAGEQLAKESVEGLRAGPITEEAMATWLKLAPENERALFIMAAAVHSAEDPNVNLVDFRGREVIDGLVKREVDRCRRLATSHGLDDQFALARLLAMAAIADRLSVEQIRQMVNADLPLGFTTDHDLKGILSAAGLLTEGAVMAPTPDIVAAALVVSVFGQTPEFAPEFVWSALGPDIERGLDRLSRLAYDADVVLGIHEPRLSDWLANAVDGNQARCAALSNLFSQGSLPLGLVGAAVVVGRTLLEGEQDEEKRARLLNNLSNDLAALGDARGALRAIEEAVELYRRLAASNAARYEPDLASSLNNLSNRLDAVGDARGALRAIEEAVQIRRRLAASNAARYEPDLASSLNNLSNRLDAVGDARGALQAIEEAVQIRRRLAASNAARYKPDLAGSLNNLSSCLAAVGDARGALHAIEEAVEIHRCLAASNAARYEPDLAMSLNNLSGCLTAVGDEPVALNAIAEAVQIRRRLAASNAARYEPDLAGSLNNLSGCLAAVGDARGALQAIEEAVELYCRLAASNAARYEPDLASSLNNLSNRLTAVGDARGAQRAIEEAVQIRRRLAASNAARYEPDLAMSLGVMGLVLTLSGALQEAVAALDEGARLMQPYAEQLPGSPYERVYETLRRELANAQAKVEQQQGNRGEDE